jgi:multidrug efflux pump
MLGATVIAIFFIPMFFWGLESLSDRASRKKAQPEPQPKEKPHAA